MPYTSLKQSALVHMLARKGTPWAKKFVADSHGTFVPGSKNWKAKKKGLPPVNGRLAKHKTKGKKHA